MSGKKSYTLKELLAQCDPDAPLPPEFQAWDSAPMVGLERLALDFQELVVSEEERLPEPRSGAV